MPEVSFAFASHLPSVSQRRPVDVDKSPLRVRRHEGRNEQCGRASEIRYTMSERGSGGSVQQHWIVANYPGLLNGIQPSASYPDIWTTVEQAEDCRLMQAGFDSKAPALWQVPAQQAAVAGYAAPTTGRSL